MHILAVISFLFLICLYLITVEAFLSLAIVMLFFAGLLFKTNPKLLILVFLCPLLSFASLVIYESHGDVNELRVVKAYDHYLVAQVGFKRFQLNGEIEKYQVGDMALGELKMENLSRNPSGYLGEITISNPRRKQDFLSRMRRARENLSQMAIEEYGFDQGSLMASLALGYKDDMNEDRKDAMKTMGIMHILSISGFHFSLLEVAFKKMKFGRARYPILGIYAFFVDSISGYRTILVLIYKIMGRFFKKDPDLITGLFLALFIQGFLSPYLIFNTGYLLTYLSTLGILLFHEKIRRTLSGLYPFVRDSLSLTLAALSLSFPVILTLTPEFSLGVFVGNMILVPLYVITTYLSFLGIMVMNLPLLKQIVLPFIHVFFDLSYHMGLFLSHFTMKISLENLLIYYVPILLLVVMLWRKKRLKALVAVIILIFLMELPYGPAMAIYNQHGTPYLRITQNFKNYDIMDYRVAKEDTISLRTNQEILIGTHVVSLKLGEKKRDVPIIYIDGKELHMERDLEYIRGSRQERKYFFVKERVMRVR